MSIQIDPLAITIVILAMITKFFRVYEKTKITVAKRGDVWSWKKYRTDRMPRWIAHLSFSCILILYFPNIIKYMEIKGHEDMGILADLFGSFIIGYFSHDIVSAIDNFQWWVRSLKKKK